MGALVVPRYIGRNPSELGEKNEIRGRRYAGIDRPENLVTPGAWLFPQSYASFIGFDHVSSLHIGIVHHTHAPNRTRVACWLIDPSLLVFPSEGEWPGHDAKPVWPPRTPGIGKPEAGSANF